jgi:hypothetical protein
MDPNLLAQVRQRAGDCCEYCRMPQAVHVRTFPIDHIRARQHGGLTTMDNLALSCLRCNSHKGPNLAGFDPDTDELTRLFHPREDRWDDHFQWDGPYLVGTTDIGRTTIEVCTMNDPDYVTLRASLLAEGMFPPSFTAD